MSNSIKEKIYKFRDDVKKNTVFIIFMRELRGYFETPVAYVFMAAFLLISGVFTFYLGNFYDTGQAELVAFFTWHPWLYLFLMPSISMRLWSEERRSGSIELLMTLPIKTWEAVAGKFTAAWVFSAITLLCTFPIWLTVIYLGNPDNGAIFSGYLASFLMAGGFLSIGSCISSLTNNQVVAFVISIALCFVFMIAGFPMVVDFFTSLGFPQTLIDTISSFSFITNFEDMFKGLISLKNIVYFASIITFWLFVNVIIVDLKRG